MTDEERVFADRVLARVTDAIDATARAIDEMPPGDPHHGLMAEALITLVRAHERMKREVQE